MAGTTPGLLNRMRRPMNLPAVLVLIGAGNPGAANEWPCFHGPRRDSKSTETGILQQWHERFRSLGAFSLPKGGSGLYWAHPVICGGRLYVRHADCLFAYDVRAQ